MYANEAKDVNNENFGQINYRDTSKIIHLYSSSMTEHDTGSFKVESDEKRFIEKHSSHFMESFFSKYFVVLKDTLKQKCSIAKMLTLTMNGSGKLLYGWCVSWW